MSPHAQPLALASTALRPVHAPVIDRLLNAAQRTTILAGAGCAGAHHELMLLAGRLNAPIVHAMRGKEFIEYDNPFDVGMTGLLGSSSGDHAMMGCDTLLMLGADLVNPEFAKVAEAAGVRGFRAETPGQVKGFSLYLLEALFSGRGDKVVDLAQVTLFR